MKVKAIKSKGFYLQIIMIIMLVIAILPFVIDKYGYSGYYTLLRFVICFGCAYLATLAYSSKKMEWAWYLGATAALYNPFFKVALSRSLWVIVDIITIVILSLNLRLINEKKENEKA